MNTKIRNLIVGIFVCAFIINLAIIYYQQKKIKSFEKTPEVCAKAIFENILLKEGFFQNYNYENTVIDYTAFVTNAKGETTQIQNLLLGKNWLTLFMNIGNCRDCLYDNIVSIKEQKKKNVWVGIAGLSQKDFKSFVLQHELEDIAYRLPNEFFSEFEVNPTVYFVIDRNLKSKYFYTPSKSLPDLTQEYFNLIEQLVDLH